MPADKLPIVKISESTPVTVNDGALAAMVHRFHYLKYALALVLVFIGSKIFVSDFLMDGDKFLPVLSLGVTFALILGGILFSLWKTRDDGHSHVQH